MRRWKGLGLACFVLLTFATGAGITALQPPGRDPQRKRAEYPIVDYNAPELSDLKERAKRREKGKKYDAALQPIRPDLKDVRRMEHIHFPADITALPVSRSAAIIVGKVTNAVAYLSPDKTGVYSEFQIVIDEVIKNDNQTPISVGETISVQRPGGRVRVPSGQIHEYRTSLNPLEVGCRYALFLIRRESDFLVFTGYELRRGTVSPLDDLPIFDQYKDASEAAFIDELRKATPARTKIRNRLVRNQPPPTISLTDRETRRLIQR
jgi:hypothetical protein